MKDSCHLHQEFKEFDVLFYEIIFRPYYLSLDKIALLIKEPLLSFIRDQTQEDQIYFIHNFPSAPASTLENFSTNMTFMWKQNQV